MTPASDAAADAGGNGPVAASSAATVSCSSEEGLKLRAMTYGWLLAAVGFAALGFAWGWTWIETKRIQGEISWGSEQLGYTSAKMWLFTLHCFILPLAVICMFTFVRVLYKNPLIPSAEKACAIAAVIALQLFYMVHVLNKYKYTKRLFECQFFCFDYHVDDDSDDNTAVPSLMGAIYVIVLLWMSAVFAVPCARAAIQCWEVDERTVVAGDEEGAGERGEKSPLLGTEAEVEEGKGTGARGGVLPRDVERSITAREAVKYTNTVCMLLGFVLFLPFTAFLTMYFPSMWEYFSVSDIQSYATNCYTVNDEWGSVVRFGDAIRVWVGGACLKFWPDIQAYYAFLYVLVLVALWAQVNEGVRIRLSMRVKRLGGATTGEVLVMLLFTALMIFEITYWMYLRPIWNDTSQDDLNGWERIARTSAQLMNCVMGLLVLPVSRNSIWSVSLGIGWEAMVKWHGWLGDVFLGLIFVHAGGFCKVYADEGLDWWSQLWWQTSYDRDNWTITLQVYVTMIFLFTHGVLTLNYIRRKYFEVFYYAHHTFLALWISTLWHGNSSWYYMIGGLTLWMVDRTIRTLQAYSRVQLHSFACLDSAGFLSPKGAPSLFCPSMKSEAQSPKAWSEGTFGDKIVYLAYTAEAGGLNTFPFIRPASKLGHVAGQYAFINVPAISVHEWHPFTISSAPADAVTTHHIKGMGKGSFTEDLYNLVSSYSRPEELEVNVEGPFGVGVDVNHYEHVVLVAGGIGITPCHAVLRDLVHQYQAKALPPQLRSVTLVWAVRSPQLFNLFEATFQDAADASATSAGAVSFDISLWVTAPNIAMGEGASEGASQVLTTQKYQTGRPDLQALFQPAAASGMKSLVFHCGPPGLEKAARAAAIELGMDYHTETFEL